MVSFFFYFFFFIFFDQKKSRRVDGLTMMRASLDPSLQIDEPTFQMLCAMNQLSDAVSSDESDSDEPNRLVSSTVVWRGDAVNAHFATADRLQRDKMSKDNRSRCLPIVKSKRNSRRTEAELGDRMLKLRPQLGETVVKWDVLVKLIQGNNPHWQPKVGARDNEGRWRGD